ncbi:hypothetical protein IFVP182_C260239 [Vibrio parahaemolyticus]
MAFRTLYPCNFIATAETVGFCTIRMHSILNELVDSFSVVGILQRQLDNLVFCLL